MLTKRKKERKKISLITVGVSTALLATTIGNVALSSCGATVNNDSKNDLINDNIAKYTLDINWSDPNSLNSLEVDWNRNMVFATKERTNLIGFMPGTNVTIVTFQKKQ